MIRSCQFLVLVFFFLMTSCATFISGRKQEVLFLTNPPGASVMVNGEIRDTTPCFVPIKRKYSKTYVFFKKDKYISDTIILKRRFNPAMFANLFFFYSLPVDIIYGTPIQYKYDIKPICLFDSVTKKMYTACNSNWYSWNKSIKPDWKFFQGTIDRKVKFDNVNNPLAVTYSGIAYTFDTLNGYLHVNVLAFMDINKSIVYKKGRNSDVLNHERRHFDISEIYARKFRKAVSELVFAGSSIDADLKKLYVDTYAKLIQAQKAYDSEAGRSNYILSQGYWDKMIDKTLDALKDFESPDVKIVYSNRN